MLSDSRSRREYDAKLQRESRSEPIDPSAPLLEAEALAPELPAPPPRPTLPRPEPRWHDDGVDEAQVELDDPEPQDGVYDGPVLRRIRLSRGIEIDEISSITKVNERYLELIETNRYAELPAAVYLQGFLREYAKCLNLPTKPIVESYMTRKLEREQGR